MSKPLADAPAKGRDYHLSLSGCGFLGLYHVGVISAFHEYAHHLCVNKIAGASAGALAAACLICNVAFGEATTSILRLAVQARRRALGPFHPGFDINGLLYEILMRILPENAHELCTGRLHVSLTRLSDGANVLLNEYSSKEELVTVLMCSCFIPFYSGLVPPKVNGVAYMDGGFSDNLPILDENTITVSPFSGENDICPEDESFNLMLVHLLNTSIAVSPANLYRFLRILFPPHPEILARMTQQGFDDAIKYLQRHNLISCTRCLAVKSSFDITMSTDDDKLGLDEEPKPYVNENPMVIESHPYDGCDDCKLQKRMADQASLPELIRTPMLQAAERENTGIINWLFKHRPVKVLSLLTLPYVLPFDITVSVVSKAFKLIPALRRELTTSLFNVLDKLREIAVPEEISIMDSGTGERPWRRLSKATAPPSVAIVSPAPNTFSCQLAITEFNYGLDSAPNVSQTRVRSRSMENLYVSRSRSIPGQGTASPAKRRQQRKSYAGFTSEKRVLSELSLDSRLSLSQTLSRQRKTSVMDALRSLDSGTPSVSSAIELTNDMLGHERGSLHQSQVRSLDQMLDVTQKKEALMAFYYTDENNRVNVTEIFDVTEPVASPDPKDDAGKMMAGNGLAAGDLAGRDMVDSRPAGPGRRERRRRLPVY